jgi:hypothetical protein
MSAPPLDPANPPAAFRPAWQLADPAIASDAVAFWERNNMLAPNTSVGERLAQVVAGAYDGGKMIAIATANIREVDFLRANLAMFRCSVDREARERRLATALSLYAFDVLERWSLEHPEAQLMGIGSVIQSRALVEHDNHAVWPDTKLTFVGYTNEGYQFRVRWFAHGTIPRFWPGEAGASPAL